MMKKLLIIVVLICFAATISFAQKKQEGRESQNDKLITALINANEVRGVYGDDSMSQFITAPEIEAIFALGKKAIPLLIAHLGDKRRLANVSTYYTDLGKAIELDITVGVASFDLLTYIIREDSRLFDKSCLKDL